MVRFRCYLPELHMIITFATDVHEIERTTYIVFVTFIFILPLLDLHCWFCTVIMHSDQLREYQPHFHTVQKQVILNSLIFISRWPTLWRKSQDNMALIFLMLNWFGSLNMHNYIFSFFYWICWCKFFFFIYSDIVKKLSAKKHCCICSHLQLPIS